MNVTHDTTAAGIDAAVTANHHVVVRRPEPGGVGDIVDDFAVAPTLDGLAKLGRRLADCGAHVAVAEPTSMSWLALSIALDDVGIDLALVGSRHVARLRGAVSGSTSPTSSTPSCCHVPVRSSRCARPCCPTRRRWHCKRAYRRRHKLLIESNRCWRRLVALGRWAFPDTWNAWAAPGLRS